MRASDWLQRHGLWMPPPPPLCRHTAAQPHPASCTFLHRSELVLHSVNVAVLGALFSIGAAPRPSNLGVQVSLLWVLGGLTLPQACS